jgi:hypothetical protein
VLDLRLAERLGYEALRQIRELIERNRSELERYGIIRTARKIQRGRGRPALEYYLTEAQALLLCALSKTERALWNLSYRTTNSEGPPSEFTSPLKIDEVWKAECRELRPIGMVYNLSLKIGHVRLQDHPYQLTE